MNDISDHWLLLPCADMHRHRKAIGGLKFAKVPTSATQKVKESNGKKSQEVLTTIMALKNFEVIIKNTVIIIKYSLSRMDFPLLPDAFITIG
jgi:hypothetical protein